MCVPMIIDDIVIADNPDTDDIFVNLKTIPQVSNDIKNTKGDK